jgi:hypothetical protein
MIRKKSGVHEIKRVDVKLHVPFGYDDFLFGMIDPFVALPILFSGPPRLQMHILPGDVQSFCHGFGHQGKPFVHGLAAQIFADHQVAGIPVHHGPDFGNIPVVKAKNFDVLR